MFYGIHPKIKIKLCSLNLCAVSQPLDNETVNKLSEILNKSQVPWKDLAEKLGMLTLTHLYQESPSPCRNLLENYQVRD